MLQSAWITFRPRIQGKTSHYACCNAWKGGLQAQTLVNWNNPYLWGLKHRTHPWSAGAFASRTFSGAVWYFFDCLPATRALANKAWHQHGTTLIMKDLLCQQRDFLLIKRYYTRDMRNKKPVCEETKCCLHQTFGSCHIKSLHCCAKKRWLKALQKCETPSHFSFENFDGLSHQGGRLTTHWQWICHAHAFVTVY